MNAKPAETPERTAFYERIDKQHMTPLWSVLGDLVTPEPRSGCQPFGWRFDAIREAMVEAGGLITAKEAERRVLILENPGLRGQSRATTSLYAGVQLVLPGEVAPAHRHTQSALRFVLEGEGAHTAVDGEKTIMRYGDFVITPPMAWHDHGNETDEPMFWLDGLDIPVVSFLDASFAEGLGEDEQEITKETGQSYAEFGHALMPEGTARRGVSPIFNYPYERSRESLEAMRRGRAPDPCHGWKLRYTNPLDGGRRHAHHRHRRAADRRSHNALPLDLRHRLRLHGRVGPDAHRRRDDRVGSQGHLRRALVETHRP